MSGYNQNWRRRDRDSRGSGGRGGHNNSNYWSNSHYGNYQNYSQHSYSQQYSQQWSWGNPNQFAASFTQRSARHVAYTPGQQQQHAKNMQTQRLPSPGSDSSKQRSVSSHQSKTPSDPHPGSEEARQKTLAQTTDKIKSCLRSFQNEKSDVLENLLSVEETGRNTEAAKGSAVTLEASGQELNLTPSDLKVIGMVNTSGLAVEEDDSGIRIDSDTVSKETPVTETHERSLKNESCTTDLQQNASKSAKNKDIVSKEADKSSATSSLETSVSDKHSENEHKNRAQSSGQGETTQSKNSAERKQIDSAETLLKLKQRIIQQFLKMGKNNLKDVLNNPRSRKFEFAMDHLMKEHRKVLSRELRGLAQSRIKGQETQVQPHVAEPSSLLDTDVAINLSHLPQELIEQLGNLLQLDLLDSAVVSEEFQPNMAVVEEESKYNVMQNIETLQVALMSEDNIKKENVEAQQTDNEAGFASQNADTESNTEEQNESMPTFQSESETLETVEQQVEADDREIVHEEGNIMNKTRKTSSDWSPYIPLGKGFMNRGEFGNLFCEFPDFMEMESTGSDEQENGVKDQTEVCDQPPPAELSETTPENNTKDKEADSNKETLDQNLMAAAQSPVEESKEEDNPRNSEADLVLNPFEDLHVPVIGDGDKQDSVECRESSKTGVSAPDDTQLQETSLDVCNNSIVPESAVSNDDTTKSILDLEETLARVDKSVASMDNDTSKKTESESMELDTPQTENHCDANNVMLEGLQSVAENAKTNDNVEPASDMEVSGETEANIVNENICETEATPSSADINVSVMPVEHCSDVLSEHSVGRENHTLTNCDEVNLNPVASEGIENMAAKAPDERENTETGSDLQKTEDEVLELYRCNIVVKTEIPDAEIQKTNTEEETMQETRHMTEIAVQTECSEELDPLNIEKFLHCLERSGQLSPHLTRLLKEQLSNKQIEMMQREQPLLSTSSSLSPAMLTSAASQHSTRASRLLGNKGKSRIRSGLRSHSMEAPRDQTNAVTFQNSGSAKTALNDIGSSSMNFTSKNFMNPEDILSLSVRREPTAISKFVFLKMLEIDKEIQKLMELKLDLYRKLQITLEMDPSTVDDRDIALVNSRDNAESSLSKDVVGHVNDHDAEDSTDRGSKPLPSCSSTLAPMVMLPMDYMLSHQPSRQKLKTLDTSVVEAVLNSFDIPDQSLRVRAHANTNPEETLQSPSRNRRHSQMPVSEVSITTGSPNRKPSAKQTTNKKKTNIIKKNAGKNKLAETVMSSENSTADEVKVMKTRDLRRKKPEEKAIGRSTRLKANIIKSEEDDKPHSGNRSLTDANSKPLDVDQESEIPVKLKSRRSSESIADKSKNPRNRKENKKETEENVVETAVALCGESLQSKPTRNRRDSRKVEVLPEKPIEIEEQENKKNDRKTVEGEKGAETEETTNKKSRGSKQRAILAINDAFALDDSSGKHGRKRKVSLKGDSLNESELEDESGTPATRIRTRSPRKVTSDYESSPSETEATKKLKLHGGNEENAGRRSTRTSLSDSGRRDSHSEVAEETAEVKRQTGLKRKAEDAFDSSEKCQRISKLDLKETWNLRKCSVVMHPLAEEQIRSFSGTAAEVKELHVVDVSDDEPLPEEEKKEKKKTVRKRQSTKGIAQRAHSVDVKENEFQQFDLAEERQEDPLGGIPDACQPPELQTESYISAVSTPLQSPPDLMVQTISPRTNLSMQDENSISTFVSDSVSVNSDGEHSFVKKSHCDISSECKDDCDHDSLHSCDTGQDIRDGTGSKYLKHKVSRKHKKDIERLTFEAHQGPILDIKTVGRHVLAASEDGFVYCYSLKSGKFKRKYGDHNSAVTCLCVVECCIEPDVSNELEAGEQVTPELFFTGSLDKHLRYFRFKTGELVQPALNIGSPIQCMDQNWGILFIGTKIGEVIQYNIKSSSIIGEEPLKLGREAILSLKATKEGPRNVLIIGTRNKPITIRDASSGLLLRSINSSWSHTVYSLVLNANEVYCGTKNGLIPVIQFQNGEQICKLRTGAGVVCMRLYNNLLFAGCYDGNIYVFSIHDKKQVSCIPGPGKMLLCLDIVKNRIIVGSKDGNKLEAWGFPQDVRNHLREAKHR